LLGIQSFDINVVITEEEVHWLWFKGTISESVDRLRAWLVDIQILIIKT
jgi:hypothetical protein